MPSFLGVVNLVPSLCFSGSATDESGDSGYEIRVEERKRRPGYHFPIPIHFLAIHFFARYEFQSSFAKFEKSRALD